QADGSWKSPIRVNGTEVMPLSSVSNKLNVMCNENGPYVMFQSDQHGFNNPVRTWNHSPVDIVAVGDSYTEGYCLPDEQTFVSLIRQRYPATINLGIEANGPMCELATIKEFAEYVRPKVVLWFYYEGNDLHDLISEGKTALLAPYVKPDYSQHLFNRQPEIDSALLDYISTAKEKSPTSKKLEELFKSLQKRGHLLTQFPHTVKLSQLRQKLGLVDGKESQVSDAPDRELDERHAEQVKPILDLFDQVLAEAKRSVESWGGRLYFVYLP